MVQPRDEYCGGSGLMVEVVAPITKFSLRVHVQHHLNPCSPQTADTNWFFDTVNIDFLVMGGK